MHEYAPSPKESRPKKRKEAPIIIKQRNVIVLQAPPPLPQIEEDDDSFYTRMLKFHFRQGIKDAMESNKKSFSIRMDMKFCVFESWFQEYNDQMVKDTKERGGVIESVKYSLNLPDCQNLDKVLGEGWSRCDFDNGDYFQIQTRVDGYGHPIKVKFNYIKSSFTIQFWGSLFNAEGVMDS